MIQTKNYLIEKTDKKVCRSKADYHAKITEIESEIPSISSLATTSVFTAVKMKYRMSVI